MCHITTADNPYEGPPITETTGSIVVKTTGSAVFTTTTRSARSWPKRPANQIEVEITDKDFGLLLDTLSVQSHSGETERMRRFITKTAKRYGGTVVNKDGNVYVTKGKAEVYPCFVAHTDTVHKIIPDGDYVIYRDPKDGSLFAFDRVTNTMTGIGGDDKCGVMIALAMIRDLPACKAVFFRDEETGCQGAHKADKAFFDDCGFAIECDRRDNFHIIRDSSGVELYSDDFAEAIAPALETYGFVEDDGTITDVLTLVEDIGIGISCCNLSAGYYLPHQADTYVIPNDVARTLALVKDMTKRLAGQRWEHTPPKRYARYADDNYDWNSSSWREPTDCPRCGLHTVRGGWCGVCQAYTDHPTECPSCGVTIPNTTGWCYLCGASWRETATEYVLSWVSRESRLDATEWPQGKRVPKPIELQPPKDTDALQAFIYDRIDARLAKKQHAKTYGHRCPMCQGDQTEQDVDSEDCYCFSCDTWWSIDDNGKPLVVGL
jgi:hypothetical protein